MRSLFSSLVRPFFDSLGILSSILVNLTSGPYSLGAGLSLGVGWPVSSFILIFLTCPNCILFSLMASSN